MFLLVEKIFLCTRKVKQGDSLSPDLFILIAKVLFRVMNQLFERYDYRVLYCLNGVIN